jgi:hypothetical protein
MNGNLSLASRRAARSELLALFFAVVMVQWPTAEAIAQPLRAEAERMTL